MSEQRQRGVFERPRGSGVWHIEYYDAEHKRHREKVGSKTVAIAAYQKRKIEIREGKFFPPRRDTLRFGELVKEVLAHKQARLATGSYDVDEKRSAKLLEGWRELAAGAITPQRIEERLQTLRRSSLSGSTVNRYRSLLSSIFTYAVRAGYLPANPVRLVPRYKESEHRIRYLTDDEEAGLRQVILKNCADRMAELDLALHTGIRRGEQWGLEWSAVDLKNGRLVVRGKVGRRFIPINETARQALITLHQRSKGSSYVCPETKRRGQRDWRRWFETAVDDADIENFRWHDLRHTFASRLVMAGVDLRSVQELLGHRSIVMTMRYAHLAPSHLKDAVAKLAPMATAQGALFHTATRTATEPSGKARKAAGNR